MARRSPQQERDATATPGRAPLAFAALLAGNAALALGPWFVRLSDVGPVSAGFWRLALALPFLLLIARVARQPLRWPGWPLFAAVVAAAFFFAADLAAWHVGIHLTKLGNATLFGNISSFAFVAWGLWMARRWPTRVQGAALALTAAGAALLMAGSYELAPRYLKGDLLALLAGLLYTFYLILVERARGALQPLPLLIIATAAGAAMILPFAILIGEQWWPGEWSGVLVLAISSQVIGQGLLVYALGVVPPMIVGLALLTQPALSAFIGWTVYGETLSAADWIGAVAIGLALVLVRLPDRGERLRAAAEAPR